MTYNQENEIYRMAVDKIVNFKILGYENKKIKEEINHMAEVFENEICHKTFLTNMNILAGQ